MHRSSRVSDAPREHTYARAARAIRNLMKVDPSRRCPCFGGWAWGWARARLRFRVTRVHVDDGVGGGGYLFLAAVLFLEVLEQVVEGLGVDGEGDGLAGHAGHQHGVADLEAADAFFALGDQRFILA